MRLGRIREVVSHFVADLPLIGSRPNADARERELEQIANAVLEYGKMQCELSPLRTTAVLVDVTEVAFRFRETRRAITRTLELLQTRGLAERTDLPQLWELFVADLDQQAGGSDVVRDPRKTPSVGVLNTHPRDLNASTGQPKGGANGGG